MMDVQAIAEWLESHGYETRKYSGRGMYGAQCLAITGAPESKDSEGADLETGDLIQLGYEIGWADANGPDDEEHPRYLLASHRAMVDQLGRGIVVYWPALRWPEAGAE